MVASQSLGTNQDFMRSNNLIYGVCIVGRRKAACSSWCPMICLFSTVQFENLGKVNQFWQTGSHSTTRWLGNAPIWLIFIIHGWKPPTRLNSEIFLTLDDLIHVNETTQILVWFWEEVLEQIANGKPPSVGFAYQGPPNDESFLKRSWYLVPGSWLQLRRQSHWGTS